MKRISGKLFTRFPEGWWDPVLRAIFICPILLVSNGAETSSGSLARAGEPVPALPGYDYNFPKDHGAHEAFLLEWWYFTGHLFTGAGRRFGYELTFFRRAIDDPRIEHHPSQWAIRHLYFAHLAVTDVGSGAFQFDEKISRAGLGKAGAEKDRMHVWIDRWSAKPVDPAHHTLHLEASNGDMGIDLLLTSLKPPTIHGENGVSRKGANIGQASHYYSLTRLETKGTLTMKEESFPVTGLSWMDHEFGSGALGENQIGWDWFSLQLNGQLELMVYMMRRQDGSPDPVSSGTLISGDGSTRHLTLQDIILRPLSQWHSPQSGARYPSSWSLEVPSAGLVLRIHPVQENQELRTLKSTQVTYWEGAVDVLGQYQGAPLEGVGYVELTGYAKPLDMQQR